MIFDISYIHTKGTRIIYDRKFLLECRRSPVAKTPPRGLPQIPGVTSPPSKDGSVSVKPHNEELLNNNNSIAEPDSNNTGMKTCPTHMGCGYSVLDSNLKENKSTGCKLSNDSGSEVERLTRYLDVGGLILRPS